MMRATLLCLLVLLTACGQGRTAVIQLRDVCQTMPLQKLPAAPPFGLPGPFTWTVTQTIPLDGVEIPDLENVRLRSWVRAITLTSDDGQTPLDFLHAFSVELDPAAHASLAAAEPILLAQYDPAERAPDEPAWQLRARGRVADVAEYLLGDSITVAQTFTGTPPPSAVGISAEVCLVVQAIYEF